MAAPVPEFLKKNWPFIALGVGALWWLSRQRKPLEDNPDDLWHMRRADELARLPQGRYIQTRAAENLYALKPCHYRRNPCHCHDCNQTRYGLRRRIHK